MESAVSDIDSKLGATRRTATGLTYNSGGKSVNTYAIKEILCLTTQN